MCLGRRNLYVHSANAHCMPVQVLCEVLGIQWSAILVRFLSLLTFCVSEDAGCDRPLLQKCLKASGTDHVRHKGGGGSDAGGAGRGEIIIQLGT